MKEFKQIVFICHRHPFINQGGAEKSVTTIMKYFISIGHTVIAVFPGASDCIHKGIRLIGGGIEYQCQNADIVFTWGSVAQATSRHCMKHNTPYVLMVRWWRNVANVEGGVGDLMSAELSGETFKRNNPIMQGAKAVVTNSQYSADVIKKYYKRLALVSYVPIEGFSKNISNKDGCITIISPDKDIGEKQMFIDIACSMPGFSFLVVNPPDCDKKTYSRFHNIKIIGKQSDMQNVWRMSAILLAPVYKNDICGTLRVTIEAMQHGCPVIASNRSGMGEKIENLVSRNATTREWIARIVKVKHNYKIESNRAMDVFDEYNTEAQLTIFKDLL